MKTVHSTLIWAAGCCGVWWWGVGICANSCMNIYMYV